MSTATLPRRHVSALPRFVAVIAVLVVLLGVTAIIIHARSTSSPAPAVTTVGTVPEPHAHAGRPHAVPPVDVDALHRAQERLSAATVTPLPVPVNAGRRGTQR